MTIGGLAVPEITKAQLLAIIQAVIGLLIAFGLDISKDKQDAIVQLVTVLAFALPLADAGIRIGRANAVSKGANVDVIVPSQG